MIELYVLLVTLIFLVWLWSKYNYNYWQRMKIPSIKPHPVFGNFKDIILFNKDPCTHFKTLYESAKDAPCVGIYIFNRPGLLLRDLDLVKKVLIKDFNMFANRYSSSDPHSDGIGANNLFFVKNPKWKDIRNKLTPVFTSGKMKQMFYLVDEIGRELDKHLCKLTENTKRPVELEVKETNALFATDVIASVAFGVHANSLKDPNSEFRTYGRRIFTFSYRRAIEFTALFFAPMLVKIFHFKVFSAETSDFIRKAISHIMTERVKSDPGMTGQRNDLIDVLVKFRKEAELDSSHFGNDLDCVIAQAALFFSAGFETSSATMSFSLYELAKRQDVQTRLREELREKLAESKDGDLSYDAIHEMKFLHNVITEVLRMYPPLPFLDRQCTVPEGYSLEPHCNFTIPNGMPVYIPASAIQRDPKYYPNPDRFQPERYDPENKDYNNHAAYLPFGIGPHNCIGERFGLLQTKVGLINILRNHYVVPCDKTPKEMVLNKRAIIIQSESGIHLNLIRDPLI